MPKIFISVPDDWPPTSVRDGHELMPSIDVVAVGMSMHWGAGVKSITDF